MSKKIFLILIFICSSTVFYAQDKLSKVKFGFEHSIGNELKNSDYSYDNSYYKLQFYYTVKQITRFTYEVLLQPELKFAKHQLLNLYFIKPDDSNYIEKRERYTKLKDIREYVLNSGFLIRKPILKSASIYVLGSVGPMIVDRETERLSKGCAFCNVVALGLSYKLNKITFDVRPSFRHVSNAGLKALNSGYDTKNIDFPVLFSL